MTEKRQRSIVHMLGKLIALLSARQRRKLAGIFAMMVVGALLEMFGIGVIPAFVALLGNPERVMHNPIVVKHAAFLASIPQSKLVVYAAVSLLLVFLIKNTYLFVLLVAQSTFTQRLQANLAVRMLRAYLYSPYDLHLQRNPSELLRNANSEALDVINSVVFPGLVLTMELLTVTAILTLLFIAEPAVSLFACVLLGGSALLFMKTIRKRLSKYGEEIQFFRGKMLQAVHESLSSVKVTKVFGREEYFLDTFAYHADGYVEANRFRQIATEVPRLFLEIIAIVGILGVATVLTAQGKSPMSVTVTLTLMSVALVRTIPSVNRITGALATLRYGDYSLETVSRDLAELENRDGASAHDAVAPLAFRSAIRFDSVDYQYPGAASKSLSNISLAIPRGSSVAIIGPTGAGKTTLVDLLLGLLEPTGGKILIDDCDLVGNVRSWQRTVGYVPQDIYLVDDSIRANIALGIPEGAIDEAAIARAVQAAQLEEFVASLPTGLGTIVGERGVRISGGQRQRIGIARALYHDPSVLIMDEATSSLDNETESLVIEAVDRLRGSRTIVVIAHRMSTIRNCDFAFVLRHGQLSASGPLSEFVNVTTDRQTITPMR